jgi:hypothetical protein
MNNEPRHVKVPGFVEHIGSKGWTARLVVDGVECMAGMVAPLPRHARPGSLFTIHRTKAGAVYLYWITEPRLTHRQIKHARQHARRWTRMLAGVSDEQAEQRELECPDCGRVDCACDHDRFMFQEAEEDEGRERPICDSDGCGYYAATHIGRSALCAKHALALIGRSEVSDFAPRGER